MPPRNRPKLILREVGSPSIAQKRDPYAQNRIAYRILRRFYRYADRIVALTEGARRDLRENFLVPDAAISLMATNAVVPPAIEDRLAQWDGKIRPRRWSHRVRRPAFAGKGSPNAIARDDHAAGPFLASRHHRRW